MKNAGLGCYSLEKNNMGSCQFNVTWVIGRGMNIRRVEGLFWTNLKVTTIFELINRLYCCSTREFVSDKSGETTTVQSEPGQFK